MSIHIRLSLCTRNWSRKSKIGAEIRAKKHTSDPTRKSEKSLVSRVSPASSGALNQIRTGDLVLTKDALCRLSYKSAGDCGKGGNGDPERARTVDL